MCISKGHGYMSVPNMKFACLNLWLGETQTPTPTMTTTDKTRLNNALWLINQVSQKQDYLVQSY